MAKIDIIPDSLADPANGRYEALGHLMVPVDRGVLEMGRR